jgi:uncharacterized damage-inducible protein DinB
MKPHTQRLQSEFEEIVRRGSDLVTRLDDAALQRRPSADGWSVAECIDHLSATGELYVRRLRRAFDEGPARSAQAEERLSLFGRLLVRIMEPPVRRIRLKVPTAKLDPGAPVSREALVQRFAEVHAQLGALITESDALDRRRLRVTTPASKRVKITLLDGLSLLAAHGRRHLWQAERALEK